MALPSILAGGKAIWSLIDDYLFDLATAWKGQYLETAQATVVVAEQYDPETARYPLILIASYERTVQNAEPRIGDGIYHLSGVTYPYEIAIVAAFMEFADAKEFAAKAAESFGDALRADPTLGGLSASNGEYVLSFDFDDTELYVRGMAAQDSGGKYTGTAVVSIGVNTEI